MLDLARADDIDLIVTTSITIFGRNTISVVWVIQEFRKIGIEIYFEKKNMRHYIQRLISCQLYSLHMPKSNRIRYKLIRNGQS